MKLPDGWQGVTSNYKWFVNEKAGTAIFKEADKVWRFFHADETTRDFKTRREAFEYAEQLSKQESP